MTYNTELEDFALPLPITQTARRTAQQFAQLHASSDKAEQVRLNTLAICVVKDYLDLMGIATNLRSGDSWNPAVQLCADVSDLDVEGLGRLECRPVRQHARTCHVPPEVWQDRIGYVVVQIDEATHEAFLLGFSRTAETEYLPLDRLQSPEALLDYLDELRQPSVVDRALVNLSQWLQNAFDAGWQAVDSLLNPPEAGLAYAFRSSSSLDSASTHSSHDRIRRAKLIDLGIQLVDRPVALTIELNSQTDGQTGIYVQVHPTRGQVLPANLQLVILDETGATFLEAQARSADNYLQLEFSGNPGEQFSVRVSLSEASVTEHFVI